MSAVDIAPITRPHSPRSIGDNGTGEKEGAVSKRRQPKSRAGCNTCKARRMKCDETKPTCSQCTDRGVECGGYARDLKWKLVGEQRKDRKRPEKEQSQSSQAATGGTSPRLSDKDAVANARTAPHPLRDDMRSTADIPEINDTPSARFRPENVWHALPHGQLFDFSNLGFNTDFFLDDSGMDFNVATDLGSLANTPSAHFSGANNSHAQMSSATNNDWNMQNGPNFPDPALSTNLAQQDATVNEQDEGIMPHMADATASVGPVERADTRGDHHKQTTSFSDTPATVKSLFDHLCGFLSVKDDQTPNPWQLYVWPLATGSSMLYNAVAAMTYLFMSNSQAHFHTAGTKNFESGLQAFIQGSDSVKIPLETALATRIALSFAEGWDDERASTGIEHIRSAGKIVQEAFQRHQISKLTGNELDRFSFLTRTWVYKDTLARLTTSSDLDAIDLDAMEAYLRLDPLPAEQQLDPLMGCAITLFPLIGRLGDIVRTVRRRSEKHNSPSIISQGAELRIAMEDWTPSFNPQRSGGLTGPISDVIQTAEAYRWAALLLLRHAVPELPWVHSIWELAEKVSIYLATIPVRSRTMNVQIFPLMAIGGEAFDEDDRSWVRQRWNSMFKRMPLVTIDKCRRITEEVWRRRDAFEAQCGACPSCGAYRLVSSGISPSVDSLMSADVAVAPPQEDSEEGSRRCRCSAATRITAPASSFPDSLAFKKGVDNITRAGNLHYTVRGDLHWLGVMKDWDWEIILG